jgi:hypothetical protein
VVAFSVIKKEEERMVCLREKELFCAVCSKVKKLPSCCGKAMELDNNGIFFCVVCEREIPQPKCCDKPMTLRLTVRNIKKEIFGAT